MIGSLKGTVDAIEADHVLIDVHGVGYLAFCPSRTLSNLNAGEAAVLLIETIVREDMIRLYGFASRSEREWFRLLMTVQGVGAKVALAILSTLSSSELSNAVALQDKAAVARAPGVGPKVAQRIVSELKNRIPTGGAIMPASAGTGESEAEGDAEPSAVADAISALVNLGYGRDQAAAAVAKAVRTAGEDADSGKLIRGGLKELAG